jgi:hypothetical protein
MGINFFIIFVLTNQEKRSIKNHTDLFKKVSNQKYTNSMFLSYGEGYRHIFATLITAISGTGA